MFYSGQPYGPARPCENITVTNCRLSSASNAPKSFDGTEKAICNVLLRNVIARGTGPNRIHGHIDSSLQNITLENIRLEVTSDPNTCAQKCINAITVDNARYFRMKDIEVVWDAPYSDRWRNTLVVENVTDLVLDVISARQSPNSPGFAAIVLNGVDGVRSGAGVGRGVPRRRARDIS